MAKLEPCGDCGHLVSKKATACPSCGRPPTGVSGSWRVVAFFALVMLIMYFSIQPRDSAPPLGRSRQESWASQGPSKAEAGTGLGHRDKLPTKDANLIRQEFAKKQRSLTLKEHFRKTNPIEQVRVAERNLDSARTQMEFFHLMRQRGENKKDAAGFIRNENQAKLYLSNAIRERAILRIKYPTL